jgi:protein-disulfide isomerase
MRRQVYGLATAMALIGTGAMALDLAEMNTEERAAFGAQVRSYLIENPEVLEEAERALEERRALAQQERDAQMVADNITVLHDDPMSPVLGDPNAPFTVVKFSDFNCGHCRATSPDLMAFLQQNPDYKLVVKEFPVLGPDSIIAASFAVSAFSLGGAAAYEAAKVRLFEPGPEKTAEYYRALATEIGVDPDLMTERMGSEEVRAHLQRNVDLATAMEIQGTPALVFEDVVIRGRIPLETMTEIRTHIDNR